MDRTGALYGTTGGGGGKWGVGIMFKLTPTDHGWDETLIYTFIQKPGYFGEGGVQPLAGLSLGDDGTLYGTAGGGGKFGGGVVFALTPSDRGWAYRVLHDFKKEEGSAPNSRLVFGKSGALYGTTKFGGDAPGNRGRGTVFKLGPSATGWDEVVLHSFRGGADGALPTGVLIRDSSGNLFGTTRGDDNGGTVFEIVAGGFFGK